MTARYSTLVSKGIIRKTQLTPYRQPTDLEMYSSDTLPLSSFAIIRSFINTLERHEVKPCISLVRYGVIPTPDDRALWKSIPISLFNKFFISYIQEPEFTEHGEIFFKVSTNPLISSTIISECLAKVPTEDEIENSFIASASKEVQVMESTARPSSINWRAFFQVSHGDSYILPHQKTDSTPFAARVNAAFRRFRDRIAYTRVWPHGTTRGVSRTAQRSLERLRVENSTSWMQASDFREEISSLSIVKHYLHTGFWSQGVCELKQKWYPSGLVPRTYFAQGGDAIRTSCYLRNIFNDLTDTYLPTERRARVDGSRLICPDGGYFYIYDLTSFTSNFHEQKSFLTSMASFFRDTTIYLIGPHLNLIERSLGDMIEEYCDTVNDLPPYEFNERILNFSLDSIVFFHHVAGFLGVPGNLATCTLAHGISIGITTKEDDKQSCAGDDGNVGLLNDNEEDEITKTIHSLGLFNDDKASRTRESLRASYLKRKFVQVDNHGEMVERVDFPLLGAVNLMNQDDPRFPELSKDRSQLRKSIAASVAKLVRDLYTQSSGYYSPGVLEYILLFLKEVYAKGALPTSGMVRGFYGSDLDQQSFAIEAAVVFPLSERYFRRDPDIVLTEDFLPWIVDIPVWTDDTITFSELESWPKGHTRTGRSNPALEKLVKFGYLSRRETERITLVGEEARLHFRRYTSNDFMRQEYEYESLFDLTDFQLKCVGLTGSDEYLWKKQVYGDDVAIPMRFSKGYRDLDSVEFSVSESFLGLEDLY